MKLHPHVPRNVNVAHKKKLVGFNTRLAVKLTQWVGTMVCAYIFAIIAIIGFPNLFNTQIALYVQWISQTFIQLTMLSVIMVGQSVISRKQELMAEEQFNTTVKMYHDIEQIVQFLHNQDIERVKDMTLLIDLIQKGNQS